MITTVSTSQPEILRNIADLHNGGQPFHADFTFANGGFWKGTTPPLIRMDLAPQCGVNVCADVRDLPFLPGSIHSAVFDPPFIHAAGVASIMGQRFGSYPSQDALHTMYGHAALNIRRALAPGGLLVWKCQDIVESGKQVWNHCYVQELCQALKLKAIDLFILVRDRVIQGHNHGSQQHARRSHSYFWVFRKVAQC